MAILALVERRLKLGGTWPVYEELWNYGFPQEMQHFVDCVLNDEQPLETGEDAREVLRMIFAAYESAGTGRKVEWPYEPERGKRPIEVWQPTWAKPARGYVAGIRRRGEE